MLIQLNPEIQTYNAYKDRDPFNPMETFNSMLEEEIMLMLVVHAFFKSNEYCKFYYTNDPTPTYQHFFSGTKMSYFSTLNVERMPWKIS